MAVACRIIKLTETGDQKKKSIIYIKYPNKKTVSAGSVFKHYSDTKLLVALTGFHPPLLICT